MLSFSSFLIRCCIAFLSLSFAVCVSAATNNINVPVLNKAPVLDGYVSDWERAPYILALHKVHPNASVSALQLELWAGRTDTHIYIAVRWPDPTSDRQHKPYVWSDESDRYIVGKEREDRVSFQFRMSGDYDVNWFSGKEFSADMWHWKSARSAPVGLAHDKMTIVSRSKLIRAFKAKSDAGDDVYVQRPSDSGTPVYKAKRYGLKESKVMQKYIVNHVVTGSIADVKAKERWHKGFWTVELSRLLDTGNDDDVVFNVGSEVVGGLAVFNRSSEDDHVISELIRYVIE